jgi:hypothetical protein
MDLFCRFEENNIIICKDSVPTLIAISTEGFNSLKTKKKIIPIYCNNYIKPPKNVETVFTKGFCGPLKLSLLP